MELVVILLAVGFVLILAETVLPGMIAGIVGTCCLIAGIVEGYLKFDAKTGNGILFGVLALLMAGFVLWVKYFPESRIARIFISQKVVGNLDAEKPELLEKTGTSLSALRPAGAALIQGRRVDVITEGQMIAPGTPVRVVAVEGLRVVVRQIESNPHTT